MAWEANGTSTCSLTGSASMSARSATTGPGLPPLSLSLIHISMILFCLLGWTPAFYMRKFGMSPVEAGYMLGTVVLVCLLYTSRCV